MKRDYYEILGVSKGVGKDEIKQSYRRLAMQYHPDRVAADKKAQAEEKFKEISEAYAVLSDDSKRGQYDKFGHAGIDSQYTSEDLFRGVDFSSVFSDLGFGGGSIFEQLFSDFGFFSQSSNTRSNRSHRGRDLEFKLELEFKEAIKGTTKTITFPSYGECNKCSGSGAKSGKLKTCPQCHGSGRYSTQRNFFSLTTTCSQCRGAGSIITEPCSACSGSGRIHDTRKFEVKVPAGVDSGSALRLSGKGEPGKNRGPAGDLYIYINVKPDEFFTRQGRHIICTVPITCTEAILGSEIQVPTIDGKVKMKIPPGTQNGKVFRIRGRGVPDPKFGGRGDHLAEVFVEIPVSLNRAQKNTLKNCEDMIPNDHYPEKKNYLEIFKRYFS